MFDAREVTSSEDNDSNTLLPRIVSNGNHCNIERLLPNSVSIQDTGKSCEYERLEDFLKLKAQKASEAETKRNASIKIETSQFARKYINEEEAIRERVNREASRRLKEEENKARARVHQESLPRNEDKYFSCWTRVLSYWKGDLKSTKGPEIVPLTQTNGTRKEF